MKDNKRDVVWQNLWQSTTPALLWHGPHKGAQTKGVLLYHFESSSFSPSIMYSSKSVYGFGDLFYHLSASLMALCYHKNDLYSVIRKYTRVAARHPGIIFNEDWLFHNHYFPPQLAGQDHGRRAGWGDQNNFPGYTHVANLTTFLSH